MIETILVPLDGSEFAERALEAAGPLAHASGARIVLVTVLADTTHLADGGEAYVQRRATESAERFGVETSARAVEGHTVETLLNVIRESGADLVVMTTHGRGGLRRAWIGSVADALVRALDRPLLLIGPARGGTEAPLSVAFRRILVPLDGSDRAKRILPHASGIAKLEASEIVLMRAVAPLIPVDQATSGYGIFIDESDFEYREQQAGRSLQQTAEALRGEGVQARALTVRHVQAAMAILDTARDTGADLIAMATRGHGGVTRFVLGSVADKVLRASPVPLLLLRSPED